MFLFLLMQEMSYPRVKPAPSAAREAAETGRDRQQIKPKNPKLSSLNLTTTRDK